MVNHWIYIKDWQPRIDLLEFSDYGFKLKCLHAIKIELNSKKNLKFSTNQ